MREVAVIGYMDSSRCRDCTATCSGAINCPWIYSGTAGTVYYAYSGISESMDALTKMLEEMDRYERSRHWSKAPTKIEPRACILLKARVPDRRISPTQWTGKNYRRVSK